MDLRDGNKSGNLRSVLGFNSKILSKNGDDDSDRPVNITDINSVTIRCNLIDSSYINGSLTDIVHSFSPTVPPGYLMNVQPRNLISLPINKQSMISQMTIRITDQSGNEINLNGERATFYIGLREQKYLSQYRHALQTEPVVEAKDHRRVLMGTSSALQRNWQPQH